MADGLSATPDWTAESKQASAYFGYSVSTAGDVNDDGYADVIVGAYGYEDGQANEGRAYVYTGTVDGLGATPDWTADGDQVSAYFGYAVSTAGDVNDDGYDDVIVGAPGYDDGQTNEGRATVYFGSSTGITTGAAGWTADGDQAGAYFGRSVSTAGDVNGDGYADVIVGAPYYDDGQTSEGRAYAYYGTADGLSATPDWTAEGDQAYAYFGMSVSAAGDVNDDGYGDVIVGAYGYENGQAYEGRASVYHGAADELSARPDWTAEGNQPYAYFGYAVSAAGDVNDDGYGDVIVGAPYYDDGQANEGRAYVYTGTVSGLSTMPDWTAESDQVNGYFGRSVSTAGDVNDDGYDDVIVGAHGYGDGQAYEGRAFVYTGTASGLGTTPDWTAESGQAYAYFGYSVSTAGDVNDDGYADVVAGAPYYDDDQTNEGRVYVYTGTAEGLSAIPDWTAESDQANARFGYAVSTAGDVNGDGYGDVVVGAYTYSNGQTYEGRAFVYTGTAEGLGATPDWTAESDQANGYLGYSVSTA
ncbi:MAG: integrin alpha, partial [Chloroflexota bacterium]|nr:integrin alpha [Chloroflexota bacterium]